MWLKKLGKVILFGYLLIVIAVGWIWPISIATMGFIRSTLHKTDWREKTKPISSQTVQTICVRLGLPAYDPRCNLDKSVYAPELYSMIASTIKERDFAYDDVQVVLGQYQSELRPTVTLATGEKYFSSVYDLVGDNVSTITFYFHGDGSIMKIIPYIEGQDD